MPVVRGDFSLQIRPGARKAYADEYQELPAYYPDLFNVDSSTKAYEDDLMSTGLPQVTEKPEGEAVSIDKPKALGSVRYFHLTYGLGYEVTQEMVEDDLYGVIAKPSSRFLARSQREAEEIVAFGVINNAATTQQAYDGVTLLNNAHPTKFGTALANRPSSATTLSVTALQASLERYMQMQTDRGLHIRMRPSMLWVPVQNFWLANEILRSEFKPFTANNEINVLRQMGLTPMECPFITITTGWYTTASKGVHKLNFLWRRKPRFDDDFDKRAQIALFMETSRFSVGSTDWRGIDGDPGV